MTRMTRIATYALVAALAMPLCAYAQEVTIEQLVALALERSPELQAARTEVAVATGQVTQAALRPNPMMAATQEQMAGGMMTTTVGVEWPLDLFRRPARVAVARSAAEITSLSVRDRERLLASAVREQAGRLLAARRTLELTNEAVAAARRLRDLLDRRVTEGGSTKLDANLAAIEALRLEADAALVVGEVDAAMIELTALVGLAPDAPLMLSDTLEALAGAAITPRLTLAAAMEARPDLREAIARIGLAEARSEEAQREARPDVTLVAGYGRAQFGFSQFGLDQRGMQVPIHDIFHSVSVGAKVTLPFSNRNQGALAAAQAERSGAEALFTARQRAARAEIDAAAARDREARRAVELYATTIRDLARQNVDVMLEAYDLGRFPLGDVLAEQRRYLDVESGYTAVLSRAYEARTAVARAFGEIP